MNLNLILSFSIYDEKQLTSLITLVLDKYLYIKCKIFHDFASPYLSFVATIKNANGICAFWTFTKMGKLGFHWIALAKKLHFLREAWTGNLSKEFPKRCTRAWPGTVALNIRARAWVLLQQHCIDSLDQPCYPEQAKTGRFSNSLHYVHSAAA